MATPVTERLSSISTVPNAAPRERLPLVVSTLLLVTLTVPDLNWVDVVTPETEIFLANVDCPVVIPATVKLSSTVTVPPSESITRFPAEVSISLPPPYPIWTVPDWILVEVVTPVISRWSELMVTPDPTFKV